jgi:hypothetical protein
MREEAHMAIAKSESHQADQIVRDLAETYRVHVAKDWAERMEGTWSGGYWSMRDLRVLQEAVGDLAKAMGGADRFISNVDGVTIKQVKMKLGGLAFKHTIKLTALSEFPLWTVVHELAHVWDAKTGCRLSKALQLYTGGRTNWLKKMIRKLSRGFDEQHRLPGCNLFGYFYGGVPPAGSDGNFNRREDFAESVTAYVYPSKAQSKVERFKDDERYRELLYYADYTQTKRWAFVDGLMRSR